MSESTMIRHSSYKINWTELNKSKLEKLLRQEKDPGIDKQELEKHLNTEKLLEKEFTKVYTSPLKRAKQTAEKISEVLKIPVEQREELREHSFNEIPTEAFQEGSEAVRQHLLDRTKEKSVETSFIDEKAGENVLMVSHGFKMRNVHRELFGTKFKRLRNDQRFREYLEGFKLKSAEKTGFREVGENR
ncbi:MAG: histidine phosphatase family protein [Candidatus Nanohaloarchaea archaeon]